MGPLCTLLVLFLSFASLAFLATRIQPHYSARLKKMKCLPDEDQKNIADSENLWVVYSTMIGIMLVPSFLAIVAPYLVGPALVLMTPCVLLGNEIGFYKGLKEVSKLKKEVSNPKVTELFEALDTNVDQEILDPDSLAVNPNIQNKYSFSTGLCHYFSSFSASSRRRSQTRAEETPLLSGQPPRQLHPYKCW